ncbi:MAG: hypothetical protein VCF07_04890 [Nitrospinota bacterium]
MASSYSLYIDESGDEGFQWPESGGSAGSRDGFFISGALVVTANRTLADNIVNQMCRMTGKNARQNLHWRRLKPDQKEIYPKMISENKNLRRINICIY